MKISNVYARLADTIRRFSRKTEPVSPSFGHRLAAHSVDLAKWTLTILLLALIIGVLESFTIYNDTIVSTNSSFLIVAALPPVLVSFNILLSLCALIGALISLSLITLSQSNRDARHASQAVVRSAVVAAASLVALAILVPALAKFKLIRDERLAQSNLKVLCGAEMSYQSAHGVYASNWSELTVDPVGGPPALPDPAWIDGRVLNGYVFTGRFNSNEFTFGATPINLKFCPTFSINKTGRITETR